MIYPGYVKTNISVNSYVGKIDKPFGKTDDNIANGMNCDEAVREMLIATYIGRMEYIVTSKAWHRLMVPARNIWAWFEDFAVNTDYKNQIVAVKKAE